MSGIISAQPFMNYFPETLDNSTWQGFVTAIYEIGCKCPSCTSSFMTHTLTLFIDV
jgi:hypothetical protein